MTAKVYQYDGCSTCKKALKFLEAKGVQYEKIDITTQPPSKSELKKMLAHMDGDLKKLFNTSGVVYREKKISEKLPKLSVDEALSLLASEGRLVKRPFILTKDSGAVGFKEAEWKNLFDLRR